MLFIVEIGGKRGANADNHLIIKLRQGSEYESLGFLLSNACSFLTFSQCQLK